MQWFASGRRSLKIASIRTFATMRSDIQRFNGSTAKAGLLTQALREDGACIVENAVPCSLIAQINTELAPHIALRQEGGGDQAGLPGIAKFSGLKTKRMIGLLGKAPSLAALVAHELVVSMTEELLVPHYCESIQLHIGLFRRLCPGEEAQPLHQDRHSVPTLQLTPGPGEEGYFPQPQWGTAAIWALSDCTAENGATRVVPRSHLEPPSSALDVTTNGGIDGGSNRENPLERPSVVAAMPAGSVLLYSAATVHGACANVTESEERDVILFGYSPGWVRQEENLTLTTPPAVARTLPVRVQELIGYSLHGAAQGMVDTGFDYGHPRVLLEQAQL